jgi:hypothetical protein
MADEQPKQQVRRYQSDGITPTPGVGAKVGAVNYQHRESQEEREERLAPAEGPHEQGDGRDVLESILGDVEAAREYHGIEEGDHLSSPQENEGFVQAAILGTAYAAGQVVKDNAAQKPSLDEQHRQHLMAAYRDEIERDDEDDGDLSRFLVDPDAAEHARLMAEVDEDAEDDETRPIGWYEVSGVPSYWDGSSWQSSNDE